PLITPPDCCLLPFVLSEPATPHSYPLPLHDALPISSRGMGFFCSTTSRSARVTRGGGTASIACSSPIGTCTTATARRRCSGATADRKSTRLNSSHQIISYAVFCLKKKKGTNLLRGRT